MSLVRFTGTLAALPSETKRALFERSFSVDEGLSVKVRALVAEVRAEGDAALLRFARTFDRVQLEALEVPRAEMDRALATLDPTVRRGLERAAKNLERVARATLPGPSEVEVEPGVVVGRRADPFARVGVYAPGGQAAYPSSVLMGVVPARAAGVAEVIVCSPPGPTGLPSDVVLAAAALAGAHRVFALGGAGAIAAMAFGTASVPRVDRIVGPGNAWVAEAKRQVAGDVGIDAPAGPSEILVVADDGADATLIARELLAQAEHDADACVVALVQGDRLANEVLAVLDREIETLPRREIISKALSARGAVLSMNDPDEAWAFVEDFAAEHLLLALREPRRALPKVRNAGTVFLGTSSSVAFGDYLTGANHVLPTAGAARRFSGLSVLDFVRWQTWQQVTPDAAARLSEDVEALALSEGLSAHAAAAAQWRRGQQSVGADATEGKNRENDRLAALTPVLPSGVEGALPHRDQVASRLRSMRTVTFSIEQNHCGEVRGADATEEGSGAVTPPFPLRPTLATVARYVPTRPPCAIDLTDNTNLFGAPPSAARVLREATVTRYPTPYADELRTTLAKEAGVPLEAIVTGCGSDDLLDATMRAFAAPGDVLAYCPPTFGIVPTFARTNGVVPVATALNVEALLEARPRLIYLCAPNNPTGALLPDGFLEALLEQTRALVVLDEAYIDYARAPSRVGLAASAERLLVIRTMSKAFGLAGLRVGWAVSQPRLAAELEKARGPYKVGTVAERVAIAALTTDRAWVRQCVDDTLEVRARFTQALRAKGLLALPSEANFVLVPVKQDATDLADELRTRGVSVRAFSKLEGIGEALRITLGPWASMAACLEALS